MILSSEPESSYATTNAFKVNEKLLPPSTIPKLNTQR